VNTVVEDFIAAMRADPDMAPGADTMARAFDMVDREADGNPHAAAMWEGICWICACTDRSVDERFRALTKLSSLKGKVYIPDLRRFLGWGLN
jgi:hypothetical protein